MPSFSARSCDTVSDRDCATKRESLELMVLDIIHRNSPIPIYTNSKKFCSRRFVPANGSQARLSRQNVSCAKPMALAV